VGAEPENASGGAGREFALTFLRTLASTLASTLACTLAGVASSFGAERLGLAPGPIVFIRQVAAHERDRDSGRRSGQKMGW
jgi:hypothetical protein